MNLTAELNMTRRLGCEFEMTLPLVGGGSGREVQSCLAEVLTANGIRACSRDYTSEPVPAGHDVCVERDGSIRGETRFAGISWQPIEVKTRILAGVADWEAVVPRTLEICKYMGARVNVSTGHHVHMEFMEARAKPTKIRSLFNLIHRFEPLIFAIQPHSRRENSYCRGIPATAARMLHGCRSIRCFRRALSGWNKYTGLNLLHVFGENPRVEFRYAAGSLDPEKCRHWMRLLNRLLEHAVTRNCQAANGQTAPGLNAWDNFVMTVGMRQNTGIYAKVSPELKESAKFLRKRFKSLSPEFSGISGQSPAAPVNSEED